MIYMFLEGDHSLPTREGGGRVRFLHILFSKDIQSLAHNALQFKL